jgi:hypothetical protein
LADSSTDTSVKSRLLDLVARGRAAQQNLIAGLSDAERAQIGTVERWAAKDHIAHMVAWQAVAGGLLMAAARGETPPPAPDEVEFNAQTFQVNRERPWAAVLADADTAYAALVAGINACTDADLSEPNHFPWRNGRALLTTVYGNGYEHPLDHITQFYRDRGDLARATAAKQAVAGTLGELFGKESELYSFGTYNLGCFYALTGQPTAALEAVREALTINPNLREWAGQDSDLVSLHDHPAFQALLAS